MIKLSKTRITCTNCKGKGWVYIQEDYNEVGKDVCPVCESRGTVPDPDWLDRLYERLD